MATADSADPAKDLRSGPHVPDTGTVTGRDDQIPATKPSPVEMVRVGRKFILMMGSKEEALALLWELQPHMTFLEELWASVEDPDLSFLRRMQAAVPSALLNPAVLSPSGEVIPCDMTTLLIWQIKFCRPG